jgi:hypothetical protein
VLNDNKRMFSNLGLCTHWIWNQRRSSGSDLW